MAYDWDFDDMPTAKQVYAIKKINKTLGKTMLYFNKKSASAYIGKWIDVSMAVEKGALTNELAASKLLRREEKI